MRTTDRRPVGHGGSPTHAGWFSSSQIRSWTRLPCSVGEQRADASDGRRAVVVEVARGEQETGVAAEEALVEHLATGEAAAGEVPGEAEQSHTIVAHQRGRLVVLLDVGGEGGLG